MEETMGPQDLVTRWESIGKQKWKPDANHGKKTSGHGKNLVHIFMRIKFKPGAKSPIWNSQMNPSPLTGIRLGQSKTLSFMVEIRKIYSMSTTIQC